MRMTPLPYQYRHICDADIRKTLYTKMLAEDLADVAMPAGRLGMDGWLALTEPRRGSVLLVSVDGLGHFHGMAHFMEHDYRMWSFDFTSFRAGFHRAAEQARGGLAWIFAHTDAACIYGVTPTPFRHALRLAEACGFTRVAQLPSACWLHKKQRSVDGIFFVCTAKTLRAAQEKEDSTMGFGAGGGSPSAPEVKPVPKQEVSKPVTEAATAAREDQKRRARMSAGLQSTVLTTSNSNNAASGGKTLLGQ